MAILGPSGCGKSTLLHLIAGLTSAADQSALIERQRRVYMQALHDLNAMAAHAGSGDDGVPALLIEGAVPHVQADLKWLELCEETLATQRGRR